MDEEEISDAGHAKQLSPRGAAIQTTNQNAAIVDRNDNHKISLATQQSVAQSEHLDKLVQRFFLSCPDQRITLGINSQPAG